MRYINSAKALVFTAELLAIAGGPLATPGVLGAQENEVPRVTIEGEVLDLVTGVPVPVAIIGVPGIDRTAISDEWGYFKLEEVPVGTYVLQVMRIGYETLGAEVPLNGEEVLALYLTPGVVPLDGIEIRVIDGDDLAWRTSAAPGQSVVGPVEMEQLRDRYISLGHILSVRHLPGSRYIPPSRPGAKGCMRLTQESLSLMTTGANPCAAVVVDGVFLSPEAAGWIYDMDPDAIFAMRFLRGAEATLQYGNVAGNGVLVIETRVGR